MRDLTWFLSTHARRRLRVGKNENQSSKSFMIHCMTRANSNQLRVVSEHRRRLGKERERERRKKRVIIIKDVIALHLLGGVAVPCVVVVLVVLFGP